MISVEAIGTKGKIISDFYGYKIFLNEENESLKMRKGWNVFRLPDVNGSVDFYVRGNEFSKQLFYFADSIINNVTSNDSSFKDALATQIIIEKININSKNR